MKKIIKLIFTVLIIFMMINSFLYINEFQIIVKETTYLWFSLIVPSLLPMYVLSNFLLSIPNFFNILYKILNPIYRFENVTSTTIFILSFFTGNPTITMMIKDAVDDNLISISEGNRLMRCSSHFSFIFINLIFKKYFLIVFSSLFLSSSLIYRLSHLKNNFSFKNDFSFKKNSSFKNDFSFKNDSSFFNIFNKIIDNGYVILLKILYIMLIVAFLSNFINHFFPFKYSSLITAFFEITIGSNYIIKHISNQFLRLLLLLALFSFNGLSIIIQTINAMNKKLEIKNYLFFRLVHCLISALFFCFFWIFF